jgi:N-ethylmaleimide reductase
MKQETHHASLFSPARVGTIALSNRIAMAPLTRLRTGAEGIPNELNAEYYAQRAAAGLVISEGTYPVTTGRGYFGQPGLATAQQVAGWRKVTDAVHRAGGRIVAQVHHAGRVTHPSLLPPGVRPVAPSAIKQSGEVHTPTGKQPYETPRALERFEIPLIIEQFRVATINAFEAGFDGVELHSANGYLPHSFLSKNTNHRTDDYGGSVENRVRFVVETARAMASVRGPESVGIKISPGSFPYHDIDDGDPQQLYPELARQLSTVGLAYMHVQRPLLDWGHPPADFDAVQLIKPHFTSGLVLAGGMYTRDEAIRAVETKSVDVVVFGRPFIANPDLVNRLRHNHPLATSGPETWYGTDEATYAVGYTDFPTTAGEA